MPTTRDYYELLGVERDADDAIIKKAFRTLARQLHPDVNSTDPGAAERFRDVAEAYEVLSNPETRAIYDRYGHAGLSGQPLNSDRMAGANISDLFSMLFGDDLYGGAGGPVAGADAVTSVSIDLRDAAFGIEVELGIDLQAACDACDATGAEPGTSASRCATCRGAGQVRQVTRTMLGQMMRTTTCPTCGGRGVTIAHPCRACRGSGRRPQRRTITVAIPAGIEHGQQVRVRGAGHVGERGAGAGDLYVAVSVADDPRFEREGSELVSMAELTMTEAALGTRRAMPTLEDDVTVEFAAGTQPGEVKVLRGQGMPDLRTGRRGNLRIIVQVLVPRALDHDQRRLVEQLDQALDDDSYQRHAEGIRSRWRRFRDGA